MLRPLVNRLRASGRTLAGRGRSGAPNAGAALHEVDKVRTALAQRHLRGAGIEIGALHHPLPVPASAKVRYVDRLTPGDLRRHYPELADLPLVIPHVVIDGETLNAIRDGSQDFVIANHFLEHCEDPIGALRGFLRVLRPGGTAYVAVPDMRHTFDSGRAITPFEHVRRDHEEGPAWSRSGHFREYVLAVEKSGEADAAERAARLEAMDYSIHFHVWAEDDLLEFFARLHAAPLSMPFELVHFQANGHENVAVLVRR